MKKYSFILIFIFIYTILKAQDMKIPVIPVPQKLSISNGNCTLNHNVKINVNFNNKKEIEYSVELIKESILSTANNKSKSASIEIEQITKQKLVSAGVDTKFVDEAYLLTITPEKVSIQAATAKGVFYGAMSLIQLIDKSDHGFIPCLDMVDYPDMKVRGVSDDISRGQVSTVENFKRIIKHIARYKMNAYMPYIEDMIQFEKYPSIGKNRGALTKAEIKEIVEFASLHFVEVIPVFQTLGHYENILASEEFLQYAEFPGAASLCIANDSIYTFLEDLLKEVFELFPSVNFNMGADESYDVGLGRSKHLVEETNLAIVHANHYKKVYDICKKYGKKVWMYGDIILQHPEILSLIPKDITIVDWHYRADFNYPSAKKFKEHGFEYYVSPSVWNFVTTFPTNLNALPNIKNIIKSGLENGSAGMINSNWGDYGAETLKELILFGYAYSAQCSWNFSKADLSVFSENYFYDFFGVNDARLPKMYQTLSHPLNQMMWHEVWRHPLLPYREPSWWETKTSPAVRISWMEWSMPELQKDISELKNIVKKNKDHLDILEFYVKLNNWFKLKLETQNQLSSGYDKGNAVSIKGMIEQNINQLNRLKDEYKQLWKSYYKPDNLSMIVDKFNRLISYFDETIGFLEASPVKLPAPGIKSEWIYAKGTNDSLVKNAEFKTTFKLDKIPGVAIVQLMGDSYVKLYVNDKFVEQVYVRRSLSLYTEYQRINMIDITKHLKNGENIIRVEAENFHPRGYAGFNLASYLSDIKNTIDTFEKPVENNTTWFGREKGSGEWLQVTARKYPYEVIAPNFKTKRTSWIER